MDMIEKVARAIFDCDGAIYTDEERMFERFPFEELDEIEQACFTHRARAAIGAMRDPSKEMTRAIFEAMFEEKFDGTSAPMIASGWDAGVDAALKEHEGAKS